MKLFKKLNIIILLSLLVLFSGCSYTVTEPIPVNISNVETEHGQLKVINTAIEHEKVHDGKTSRFWDYFTVSNGESRYLHIDIGDNDLHFKERSFVVSGNNDNVNYKVYIDCNVTTNGTLRDNIHNSNTNINLSDNTKIYLDPVFNNCLDQTDFLMIPDTNRAGAGQSDLFEWLYKANTSLIVEIENTGNLLIDVNLRYKWYINGHDIN